MKQMLDGNGAAAEALKLARVNVISAYPITPQSPIAEKLSQYAADGTIVEDKNAKIYGYVAGLGGRDITEKTIEKIFLQMLQNPGNRGAKPVKSWIDTRKDALDTRNTA